VISVEKGPETEQQPEPLKPFIFIFFLPRTLATTTRVEGLRGPQGVKRGAFADSRHIRCHCHLSQIALSAPDWSRNRHRQSQGAGRDRGMDPGMNLNLELNVDMDVYVDVDVDVAHCQD